MGKVTLYGISNCDTVRKAKRWLDAGEIEYEFHDFRKNGLDETMVRKWAKALGWEPLINKRGTTWRKLSTAQKDSLTSDQAIKLMVEYPTVIKRPVLQLGVAYYVGFDEARYQSLF